MKKEEEEEEEEDEGGAAAAAAQEDGGDTSATAAAAAPTQPEMEEQPQPQPPPLRERDPIASVCSSSRLDEFFAQTIGSTQLQLKLPVPRSESADYVSERTTGMALPQEQELQVIKNYSQLKEYFFPVYKNRLIGF